MANNKDSFKKQVRCSFCGKTQDHVRRMISGPNNTYICNECVLLCNEIVSDDVESIGVSGEPEIKKPREIKEILDQYVVGQDAAKKALSVAWPRAPPRGWWIMISAWGRALRLPFAPAASRNAPIEAARPMHSVETSHFR